MTAQRSQRKLGRFERADINLGTCTSDWELSHSEIGDLLYCQSRHNPYNMSEAYAIAPVTEER